MPRLIDADALIEKLEAWKKEAERRDANINYTFASAIIAQVNTEPTIEERKTGQWIPCNWHTKEENLPQECKSVLICMKDSYGYRIGISYRTDYNRWEGFGRVNVIAWMPQPWIPLPEEARKENQ